MANHRARAQFDRAKWRLALLLPLWALQLVLAMAMTGLFAWRLGDSVKNHPEREATGGTPTVEFAWEAANIALSFVAACCTLFEMAKLMAESLTPWTMLFTHVVKLACALAILALDITVYVVRAEAHYSIVGLGLDAALIVTAVVLAVYAIVIYRRLSAYDDYVRPVNFKGYGFNDEDDFSYSSRHSILSSSDKRPSLASIRHSIHAAAPEPADPEGAEQTASHGGIYSHQRDTQFDDYVARRNGRRLSLDAASSAEAKSSTPSIKTRPRGPSYTSDHVLVAVPEEGAECLDGCSAQQQMRQADRQALLESSQGTSRDDQAGGISRRTESQETETTAPRLLQR
ncbi:hypothetical protein HRG_003478 [Hirsutella rhossiliensis]|uniref:Transmembrane protein n=1 Tax=Hirsutella rhossiliensis TaxID=111463 RepID=A0A9P8N200_9HYPO|nr:uncharacterized protein HRG_03478 [Hirsutella rhossiliensis]KAH0965462.1 hypothetical protein HRG_03478 [Hirsutella rhossiliensis]